MADLTCLQCGTVLLTYIERTPDTPAKLTVPPSGLSLRAVDPQEDKGAVTCSDCGHENPVRLSLFQGF